MAMINHIHALSHLEQRLSEHSQTFESIRKERCNSHVFFQLYKYSKQRGGFASLQHSDTLLHPQYSDTMLS